MTARPLASLSALYESHPSIDNVLFLGRTMYGPRSISNRLTFWGQPGNLIRHEMGS